MSWLEAVLLGTLQGLTEFLPVSSSANIAIWSAIFHRPDPGASFTAVIQIGTELAVIFFFWRDIVRIAWAWLRSLWTPALRSGIDARMGWYVIIGSIPIGIAGVLFQDTIKTSFRNLYLIATMLIVFGLILGLADRVGRKVKPIEQLNVRDGVLYGLAQMLALIPGVSRSGGTISAGLFLGYTREAATRYAFLLAIPAVVAAGLFTLPDVTLSGGPGAGKTLVATVVAFIVGFLTIGWLLRYVRTKSYAPFVIYRVGLGLLTLVLLATGWIETATVAVH